MRIDKRSRMQGAIIGSAIGDVYGSIVATRYMLEDNYHELIDKCIKPLDKYSFLKKGENSYCFQMEQVLLDNIVYGNRTRFYEGYIKRMISLYLKSDYKSLDIIFSMLCYNLINSDEYVPHLCSYDKISAYPLVSFLPIGIFGIEYMFIFIDTIGKIVIYEKSTMDSLIFSSVLLTNIIETGNMKSINNIKIKGITDNINHNIIYYGCEILNRTHNFRDAIYVCTNDSKYKKLQNELGFFVGLFAGAIYGIDGIPDIMKNELIDINNINRICKKI